MKKILYILLFFCLITTFTACGEDEKVTKARDETGPVLTEVLFSTSGGTDKLVLRFDESVLLDGTLTASDFQLPVTDDSLGTGPSFEAGTQAFEIIITLGSGYAITAEGDFFELNTMTGDPSGIGLSASALSVITDASSNQCQGVLTESGYLDIKEN